MRHVVISSEGVWQWVLVLLSIQSSRAWRSESSCERKGCSILHVHSTNMEKKLLTAGRAYIVVLLRAPADNLVILHYKCHTLALRFCHTLTTVTHSLRCSHISSRCHTLTVCHTLTTVNTGSLNEQHPWYTLSDLTIWSHYCNLACSTELSTVCARSLNSSAAVLHW